MDNSYFQIATNSVSLQENMKYTNKINTDSIRGHDLKIHSYIKFKNKASNTSEQQE